MDEGHKDPLIIGLVPPMSHLGATLRMKRPCAALPLLTCHQRLKLPIQVAVLPLVDRLGDRHRRIIA